MTEKSNLIKKCKAQHFKSQSKSSQLLLILRGYEQNRPETITLNSHFHPIKELKMSVYILFVRRVSQTCSRIFKTNHILCHQDLRISLQSIIFGTETLLHTSQHYCEHPVNKFSLMLTRNFI